MKSTSTYWNPLSAAASGQWQVIDGSDGNITQLTIAEDPAMGDYTRLTQFAAGYSTATSLTAFKQFLSADRSASSARGVVV
ncbi:MAG: hypothetical protein O2890_00855 [Cyanobacteria bacterium]|nr:hypothetical protein [Cyanobacteriota bacterium]MDA0864977.1 hypothetical protein [Cyanobacteriota bacterium]